MEQKKFILVYYWLASNYNYDDDNNVNDFKNVLNEKHLTAALEHIEFESVASHSLNEFQMLLKEF